MIGGFVGRRRDEEIEARLFFWGALFTEMWLGRHRRGPPAGYNPPNQPT